jgi:protein TonB
VEQSGTGRRWNRVLIVAAALALIAMMGFGLKSLLGGAGTGHPKPPKISLLPNTPPPPPPPPKEEKKPEPPKVNKEVREQPPEQKLTPPPETVMSGPKGDAPSDFKAGEVTKEDYSGKLVTGEKGGGGRGVLNPFNVYASTIKNELQRMLSRRSELKRRQYRVEVHVWVGDDGSLKKYEMLGTTNDTDTDAAIRNALAGLPAFSEPPPPRMPQPVRLRIVTSGRA